MKLIYKDRIHEGVGFSKNGHQAYLNGEKPLSFWESKENLIATSPHHIERYFNYGKTKRFFVMFYKQLK